MFTVLRRFSIVMTMILEFVLLGVRASLAVKVSVALMVAGAIIAALYVSKFDCFYIDKIACRNDLTFDAIGYTLILLNDICTASQGVFMKQKLDAKDLGQYGLMYYNSLLMLPLALALAVYTGDFADVGCFNKIRISKLLIPPYFRHSTMTVGRTASSFHSSCSLVFADSFSTIRLSYVRIITRHLQPPVLDRLKWDFENNFL
jgi:hypothetical protein